MKRPKPTHLAWMRPARQEAPQGQVLATVGASMVALLLIAALVIDLGLSWMLSRHAQNAADSAALAAARWVPDYDEGGVYHPTYGPRGPVPGPAGYMWQEACASARANGFFPAATDNGTTQTGGCIPANDGDRSATLTVNYPPAVAGSGTYSGAPGFVQVIIAARHESFFGRLIGSAWANVSASAVVANKDGASNAYSLVALNPNCDANISTISGNAHGASIPEVPSPWFGVGGLLPASPRVPGSEMLTSIVEPKPTPPDPLFAPPTVSFTPAKTSTNANTMTFTVTFSVPVSTPAPGAFSNVGSSTGWATVSPVTTVTPVPPAVAGRYTSYTVVVGTVSPLVNGQTLILRLAANSVTDASGSAGPNANPAGSRTATAVTIDLVAPTLTTFAPTSVTTTGSSTLTYTLTFNEPVTKPTSGNFSISGTSSPWSLNTISAGPASSYTVTLVGTTPSDGGITLTFSRSGVTDVAGNALPAGGTNNSFTYASPAVPQVTSLTGTAAASAVSITYTLTFKNAVSGLLPADFQFSGSGTGLDWAVDSVSPSTGPASSYTVVASIQDPSTYPPVNGDTIILILNANTVASTVSPFNSGPAAAYTAATVTLVIVPPKVSVGGAVFINSTCASSPPDDQCGGGGGALSVSNNSGLQADQGVWIAGSCNADPNSVTCLAAANTNCPHEGATKLGDPLGQLGAPRMPGAGMCDTGKPATATCNFSGGKTYYTSPGFFPGGWDVKGKGTTVWMNPGIYWIGGGGITQKSGTFINTRAANGEPAGVMIFSSDNPAYRLACIAGTQTGSQCQGQVSLKGTLAIDPISIGTTVPANKPYRGLLIWQDGAGSCPTAAACGLIYLSAGGSTAAGTIYAPRWTFTMAGQASGGSYPIQAIVWNFKFTGGSTVNLTYDGDTLWHVDQRGLVY